MKIKIFIAFNLILCACGKLPELPYFDNPQPEGQKNEIVLAKKLLGTYESLIDSGLLIITEREILLKSIWHLNVPLIETDSVDILTLKDTVYHDSHSTMTVKVRKDSVYQRTVILDTLYFQSNKYVIKKFKGYYFLNKEVSKNRWSTATLRITDRGLLLGPMKTPNEISLLVDQSSSESDSLTYIKPSENELRKFLENKEFNEELRFVRIEYGL